MRSERRKLQQRQWARENRAPKMKRPQECVRKATDSGDISLVTAGLVPGARYIASPQPNGAILLHPINEEALR